MHILNDGYCITVAGGEVEGAPPAQQTTPHLIGGGPLTAQLRYKLIYHI